MENDQGRTGELVWHGAELPLIPSGEYTARCIGFQGPDWVRGFGRWGLRLEFELDPDNHRVSAFCSFGENPDAPKIGQKSKYYRWWVMANGGMPRRGEGMSPSVIADPSLAFTVHVSDAKTDGNNQLKDSAFIYSRIDKIVSVKRISPDASIFRVL